MPGDIKLFKIRLTQLKNTLLKRGRISENALFSAFNLNTSKDLKVKILDVLSKYGFTTNAGIINTNIKSPDPNVEIKKMLNDALPILLESFEIRKEDLPQKKTVDAGQPSAIGLFSMKDGEESGHGEIKDDFVILKKMDGETVVGSEDEKIDSPIEEPAPKDVKIEMEKKQSFQKLDAIQPAKVQKEISKPPVKETTKLPEKSGMDVKYKFYVCNRCGAETSKLEIMKSGKYLECPKCYFQFSPHEALLIYKTAEEIAPVEKVSPVVEQRHEQREMKGDHLIKPSDLLKKPEPKKDASLVRPSELFSSTKRSEMARPSTHPNILKEQTIQK
ncbi:MAG: hypothetical protein ACFFCS_04930, partial [Candidatus Hodarchaeota archaeon]